MGFTAADVKNLREMTGVGMMDCKKALAESDGNIDKAIEWLREKGLAAAQKKAGRIAAEGMAYAWVCPDCGVGSIVEVNAESDFVAKNDLFVDYVHNVAKVVAKDAPADLDALFACKYPGTDKTVLEEQNDKVLVIGENIKVRRFAFFTDGISVPYVHAGGKIGVLVNLETGLTAEQVETVGKDVAMQIAAASPLAVSAEGLNPEVVEHEREVYRQKAREEGKPEQIIEKIAEGAVKKFCKDVCLLDQLYIRDDKMTISDLIKGAAKTIGEPITVVRFVRIQLGAE